MFARLGGSCVRRILCCRPLFPAYRNPTQSRPPCSCSPRCFRVWASLGGVGEDRRRSSPNTHTDGRAFSAIFVASRSSWPADRAMTYAFKTTSGQPNVAPSFVRFGNRPCFSQRQSVVLWTEIPVSGSRFLYVMKRIETPYRGVHPRATTAIERG